MLLEKRPPDGLRGVGGEDEVDGLVLERVEDLLPRLAELRDEALERLLDVRLRRRGGLVGEVPTLELDPAALRDLHFLGEVGEVEHVREGTGDDDGVPRRQAGELAPELAEPSLIPVVLVLRRELVALLDLRTRRERERRQLISTASPIHADLGGRAGIDVIGAYEFAQVGAVQVLEDVKEAVDEEGVVLDELVVLGDLPGGQQPQLRVDRLVPLRHRGRGGSESERIKIKIPARRDRRSPPSREPAAGGRAGVGRGEWWLV